MIEIFITPVPKPRMTRSDKWKKRPVTDRYWAFKDELLKQLKGNLEPRFHVIFYIPMPKSWSKKRKLEMNGKPHQVRPDVDNYEKSFMDALCEDDSYIYDVRAEKYWAVRGRIILIEGDEYERESRN